MPKSRNRKNHKQKLALRNKKIREQTNKINKLMEEEFKKEMDGLKERSLEIEEVDSEVTNK